MVEKQIINLFMRDRKDFTKYYKYVNINYIKNNYVNIYKVFNVLSIYYSKYSTKDNCSVEDLELCYLSNYLLQDSERKELRELLESIFSLEVNLEGVITLLEEHRRRSLAGDIAKMALDVEDGRSPVDDLLSLFSQFELQEVEDTSPVTVNMNLAELYTSQVATPGLRWRLKFLNESFGSLRKGDFGFIFARPETGKTTFLASEISHMVEQTDGNILWFNNEEQGNKVGIRCFQAVLGMTTDHLWGDLERNQKVYDMKTKDQIKIYDFEDSSSIQRIEQILKTTKPALIIFDQIDKLKGFKAERKDLELKAIYQWAREIAKTYAPVIAVSQASGEAEGKTWLTMDMVDGSKTAKQGEADWILGIGKESDNTSRFRYFNICKNKLLGDSDTLPEKRHGSAKVMIRAEVARYEDL
jgi:KaiC/GvpD/RAD55 family RecA-like ATPase